MGEGREGSRHQAGVGIILARLLAGCCAAIACSLGPASAQEPATEQKTPLPAESSPSSAGKIPSFAELEAAGAVIGEVRIDTRDIFDLADEKENGILYRAANALHIQTRAVVVRRQLLFKPGERVSVRLIEETERLMRSSRIFYDVSIVPVAYHDGESNALSIARPFYALDTRWAAGFSTSTDTRIDSVFRDGAKVAQFRHMQDSAETFGGWSAGLVDHWTHRYSVGLSYLKDTYKVEPHTPPPPP